VSAQFGKWNFDGAPVHQDYLMKVAEMLAPYGPDGGDDYIKDSVGVLYRAFHTTKESRKEAQPFLTPSGAVLTWDGRLDNRTALISDLRHLLTAASSDVSIVAAAYERWGTACFAKLLGDWALSICNPVGRSLILAKDPIGTRHLYYSLDRNQVTWSTILDPLLLLDGNSFALEEEYIAGWLSFFPATHLTPYVGIHSVPPSSSVFLRPRKHTVSKYWDFDPPKRIRYRTDGEYEEHFRTVFAESIRRRLRSDRPILAELSGGMDSSSVVCMADTIIARGSAETPRLDTVSYYDDSEPNWNERPFFTKVEEKRGRTGCHIDVASQEVLKFEIDNDRFAVHPGSGGRPKEAAKELAACMTSQGSRVVLSGIGGDEVMGGVPTPMPELEDLLARGHFRTLAHQLEAWALNKRKPWFYLLFEAAREFFPPALVGVPKHKRPASWLKPDFVKRNRSALRGYQTRLKLFGPLPSFQKNVSSLQVLQRQLACDALSSNLPREKRYPYLDRSLLEFIFAAPREQLVRPGQRRSLMRRALVDIVPGEILNRKRKAYVARSPLAAISADWTRYSEITRHMAASGPLGIVDAKEFLEALQKACLGQAVSTVAILRTLGLERWLRCTDLKNVVGPPRQFAEQK
jgi:asparagine synthase (glutamine-hydrolysing)